MTSLIGWVYILFRHPYRVGDRIKIGDATGDVIDVGYIDTALWEFGGPYLSTDHPSGRMIKFPNNKVLDSIVYNYSGPHFPYIWKCSIGFPFIGIFWPGLRSMNWRCGLIGVLFFGWMMPPGSTLLSAM